MSLSRCSDPCCPESLFSLELFPTLVLIANTLWPTKRSPVTLIWDCALFRVRCPTSISSLQRSLGPGVRLEQPPPKLQIAARWRKNSGSSWYEAQTVASCVWKQSQRPVTCGVSSGVKGGWVWKREVQQGTIQTLVPPFPRGRNGGLW